MHHSLFAIILCLGCLHTGTESATLNGRITNVSGSVLVGVNVHVQGVSEGAQTDSLGRYRIDSLERRIYIVRISHVGYAVVERRISIEQDAETLDVSLDEALLPGQEITVTATRAIERESPVTFSNVGEKEIQDRFHTQGIPTMLSELPSTTTYSEGGNNVGYTYLTLRGFDQRRISVMINGVPQNDPEDHNVYWVNFPDLASSLKDIQVQRGAGSAFYGPASIGGSINLVTDRFSPEPKLTVTSGYGSYDTRKLGITLNSGMLNNSWVLNAHLSKTQSDG